MKDLDNKVPEPTYYPRISPIELDGKIERCYSKGQNLEQLFVQAVSETNVSSNIKIADALIEQALTKEHENRDASISWVIGAMLRYLDEKPEISLLEFFNAQRKQHPLFFRYAKMLNKHYNNRYNHFMKKI